MGWTEKQIKEDNTIEFLEQIAVYMSERNHAEKMQEMKQRLKTPKSKGK